MPVGLDPNVRAYADASEKTFTEMSARPQNGRVPFAYLALSGGGGDGAYGAGLLNGWTESGKRPEFSLVSGVSTGALIAPFAFVGPEYDALLKDIYTSGVASTLVQSPSFANVLFGSGLFGDGRLRELVRRYVTPDLLAAIAAEHAKGRRLLVVTTNLDAQRAVVWNMGAIAARAPRAARPLHATCSPPRPASRPCSRRNSSTCGGGAPSRRCTSTVRRDARVHPPAIVHVRDGRSRRSPKSDIYVMINGRLEPEFELAQNNTLSIVERAFTTASRARSRATLASTYAFTRATGSASTSPTSTNPRPDAAARGFDTGYMRSLYETGYETGRSGTFWRKSIPVAPLVKASVTVGPSRSAQRKKSPLDEGGDQGRVARGGRLRAAPPRPHGAVR